MIMNNRHTTSAQMARRVQVEPKDVDTETLLKIIGRYGAKTSVPARSERVLRWHDDYRNTDRVLRWQGPCIGCGVQTWAFDDGENDPRGITGDSTLHEVDLPDDPSRPPSAVVSYVRACAMCANDEGAYRLVQQYGKQLGVREAMPYNYGGGHQ